MKNKHIFPIFISTLLLLLAHAGGFSATSAQDAPLVSNCSFLLAPTTTIYPLLTRPFLAVDPNNVLDRTGEEKPLGTGPNQVTITVLGLTNNFEHWIVQRDDPIEPNILLKVQDLPLETVRAQCRFSVWGEPNKEEVEGLDLDEYLETNLSLTTWHKEGYEGENIRIGVLDSCFTGYQELLNNVSDKALFPTIRNETLRPTNALEEGVCENNTDHGTKVVEVLHKIAPKATYYVLQIQGGIATQDPSPTPSLPTSTSSPTATEATSTNTPTETLPASTEDSAASLPDPTGTASPTTDAGTTATPILTETPSVTSTSSETPTQVPTETATIAQTAPTATPLKAADQFGEAVNYLLAENVDIIVYAGSIFDNNLEPYYQAVYRATEDGVLWVNSAGNIGAGYFYLETKSVTQTNSYIERLSQKDLNVEIDNPKNSPTNLRSPLADYNDISVLARFPQNTGETENVYLTITLFDQLGTGVITSEDFDKRSFDVFLRQQSQRVTFSLDPDLSAIDARGIPGDTGQNKYGTGDGFVESYLGMWIDFHIDGDQTAVQTDTRVPIEIIVSKVLPGRYEPTTVESLPGYVTVPGDMPDVLTVGSYEPFLNELAWNSSRSNNLQASVGISFFNPDTGRQELLPGSIKPDITGPNYIQIRPGVTFSDTSAATPVVAGAAALLLERERETNPSLDPINIKQILIGYGECLMDSVEGKEMKRVILPLDPQQPPSPETCIPLPSYLTFPTRLIPTGITIKAPSSQSRIRDTLDIQANIDTRTILADSYVIEMISDATSFLLDKNGQFIPLPDDYKQDNVCEQEQGLIPITSVVSTTLNMAADPARYPRGNYTLRIVACAAQTQLEQGIVSFPYNPQGEALLQAPTGTIQVSNDIEGSNILSFSGIADGGIGYIVDYQNINEGKWRVVPRFNNLPAARFDALPKDYTPDTLCQAASQQNALKKAPGGDFHTLDLLLGNGDNLAQFPSGNYKARLILCELNGTKIGAMEESTTDFTLEYKPSFTLNSVTPNIDVGVSSALFGTAYGDEVQDYIIAFKAPEDSEDQWRVATPNLGLETRLEMDTLCSVLHTPPPATPTLVPTTTAVLEATQIAPASEEPRELLPRLSGKFFEVRYNTELAGTQQQYVGVLCGEGDEPLEISAPILLYFEGINEEFEVTQVISQDYKTVHLRGTLIYGSNFRYYVVRIRPETRQDESPWTQIVGPTLNDTEDVCAAENDPAVTTTGMLGFPRQDGGIEINDSSIAMFQMDSFPLAGTYEVETTVCLKNNRNPNPYTILFSLPGSSLGVENISLPLFVPSETTLYAVPDESTEGISIPANTALEAVNITEDRSWIQTVVIGDSQTTGWLQPGSLRVGASLTTSANTNNATVRRYVFASDVTGLWNIYSAEANNRNQRQLTNLGNNEYPSQYGNQVVFTSDRDGNQEIYLMNLDGSNQRNLSQNAANDYRPVWSPDGRTILFESDRDGGNRKLFALSLETGVVNTVTTEGVSLPCCVSWSTDNQQIVYAARANDNYDIYRASIDGSNVVNLTNSPNVDVNPSWQPNGNIIVFQSENNGKTEIYRVSTEGGDPVQLTDSVGGNFDPSWLGNGLIMFSTFRNGQLDVYIMNIDGSQQSRLLDNPAPSDETSADSR